jgi:hypothetical protein
VLQKARPCKGETTAPNQVNRICHETTRHVRGRSNVPPFQGFRFVETPFPFVAIPAIPGRCPGLICRAPSGQNPKRPTSKSARAGGCRPRSGLSAGSRLGKTESCSRLRRRRSSFRASRPRAQPRSIMGAARNSPGIGTSGSAVCPAFSSIANCDFQLDLSQCAINVDCVSAPSQSDAVNRANHQQGSPAEILGITKARFWHIRTRSFNLV